MYLLWTLFPIHLNSAAPLNAGLLALYLTEQVISVIEFMVEETEGEVRSNILFYEPPMEGSLRVMLCRAHRGNQALGLQYGEDISVVFFCYCMLSSVDLT
jgi:hypothetical protein